MNSRKYQSEAGLIATLLAIGSLAIGTLLLALRLLLPRNEGIIEAGFYYVLLAALAHFIALLFLGYCSIVRGRRDYYYRKIFLLLCNIPVAGLYTYIAFEIIR